MLKMVKTSVNLLILRMNYDTIFYIFKNFEIILWNLILLISTK
jgi:hypothetical protein